MAANQVQICNMALAAFGQRSISSIDEQSEQARKCKLFYDQARLGTLRGSAWVFALTVENLALIASSQDATTVQYLIPGYQFLYAYPPKAVSVQKVYADIFSGNVGAYGNQLPFDDTLIFGGAGRYNEYDFKHTLSDPYKITQSTLPDTSAIAIACDMNPAIIEYVRDESNTDLFDVNFVDAFIYKLAAMLAKPLTGDDNIVKEMLGIYQASIDKATRLNSQQGFTRPHNISTTVAAR